MKQWLSTAFMILVCALGLLCGGIFLLSAADGSGGAVQLILGCACCGAAAASAGSFVLRRKGRRHGLVTAAAMVLNLPVLFYSLVLLRGLIVFLKIR